MITKAIKTAELIKQQRAVLKISQKELSKKLKWGSGGTQVVSNIERGNQQIPAKEVNRLSIELMVDRSKIVESMVHDYHVALMIELNKDLITI